MVKSFITVMLVSFVSFSAMATSVLLPAKTFQFKVVSGNIDWTDIKAEISIRCSYKKGIFYPERYSCGKLEKELQINSDGSLQVPQILKFDNWHGKKTENYEFVLTISQKSNEDNFIYLSGNGFQISEYINFKKTIYIVDFAPSEINVTLEGMPLKSNNIIREPHAFLGIYIELIPAINNLLLGSSAEGYQFVADNSAASRIHIPDIQKIILKGGWIEFVDGQTARLRSWLKASSGMNKGFEAIQEISLQHQSLEDIKTIDLIKK